MITILLKKKIRKTLVESLLDFVCIGKCQFREKVRSNRIPRSKLDPSATFDQDMQHRYELCVYL